MWLVRGQRLRLQALDLADYLTGGLVALLLEPLRSLLSCHFKIGSWLWSVGEILRMCVIL